MDNGVKMEKFIDLHTHSNKSDGSLSPAEVVREAKKAGLAAVALSDHDNFDGVEEAMAEGEKAGIEVIPAIEFSVKSETQNHIIALYPDIHNKELNDFVDELRRYRKERNEETCRRLNSLGFDITLDDVKSIAGSDIIGRAHFGRILYMKGFVSSIKEAFDLWLGSGKPAYTGANHPDAGRTVEIIRKSGGLSFVAHLNQTKLSDGDLVKMLTELKSRGLNGVEGYYTEYTPEMQEKYQAMAKDLGLLISGGSDFHGAAKPHISIGTGTGNLRIPYSVLENIKKAKEQL